MDFSALLPALVAVLVLGLIAFAVWRLLRDQARNGGAHSERRSAGNAPHTVRVSPEPPPAAPPPRSAEQSPTTSSPLGPVSALMTYTKADGSTSTRSLRIYSRNIRDGQTYSLNCRQVGQQVTKKFLVSGIDRLELPEETPPLSLTESEAIREWLERCIPEHTVSPAKPTPGSSPEAVPVQRRRSSTQKPAAPPSVPPPPPEPHHFHGEARPTPLADLLPDGARGFAVLDLETTGTGRSCRIVEIALVRLDPQGRITEEWETLVHPGIPIPNGHVHGIDDELVAGAPSFGKIAGTLAEKLHEHVLVAHNLRSFDGPILEAHFAEVNEVDLSLGEGIDTMPTTRVKLVDLCARHGVVLDGGVAHTALGDTRALVQALRSGMAHLQPARCAVAVQRNGLVEQPCRIHTRAMAANAKPPKGWHAIALQLEAGQMFVTTGPKSVSADTEIKRAEAHGINLGLAYHKTNAIPKRTPPAFLLSTSLNLDTRKMREARAQGIPVVLCRDFLQARDQAPVRAWIYKIAQP